jgi:hypothetical protein
MAAFNSLKTTTVGGTPAASQPQGGIFRRWSERIRQRRALQEAEAKAARDKVTAGALAATAPPDAMKAASDAAAAAARVAAQRRRRASAAGRRVTAGPASAQQSGVRAAYVERSLIGG